MNQTLKQTRDNLEYLNRMLRAKEKAEGILSITSDDFAKGQCQNDKELKKIKPEKPQKMEICNSSELYDLSDYNPRKKVLVVY